jgi:tetratricopeptide (TPR) repeat protein
MHRSRDRQRASQALSRLGIVLLAAAASLVSSRAALAGTDYWSPQRVGEFAEYLFRDGEYLRAASEYERYMLLSDSGGTRDSLLLRIGQCYRLAGQPSVAIKYLERVGAAESDTAALSEARFRIAHCRYLMGQYNQSLDFIERNRSALTASARRRMELLEGADLLFLKRWREATGRLCSQPGDPNDGSDQGWRDACVLVSEAETLPHKSPVLAAIMSTVIPGSGKMYAGRAKDGAYALLTIGLTAWQAYDGFHKDGVRSTKGWIYGTLCAGFHLGNIYGSAIAVRAFNEHAEGKLLAKAGAFFEVQFR